MNLNPMKLLELKKMRDQFASNHPKFPKFIQAVSSQALTEGTVIEINVTTPSGSHYVTNLKLQESDISMLRSLMETSDRQ